MHSKSPQSSEKQSTALIDHRWQSESRLHNPEFDRWMTRQLNCLVGRHLAWSTGSSRGRGSRSDAR
jgi:hypothetical protein